MSTIKSSAENLTLNADGANNDIKFQSNGSEVASIDQAGVLVSAGGSTHADNVKAKFGTGNDLEIYHDGSNSRIKDVGTGVLAISGNELNFNNADNSTNLLIIKDDGRGLSQFTAKAWVNFNGSGTLAIRDSHNVSSVTDNGTGQYTVNFANAMANANYCPTFAISSDNWGNGARSGNTMMIENGTPPTTSALRLTNAFGASSSLTAGYGNLQFACVTIFGD